VRVATDGQEALDLLLGTGACKSQMTCLLPHLILLDLNLPKVAGIEVLRRLKADSRTRNIPVVILTVSRLGAKNYIIKPVEFESLVQVTPLLDLRWVLLHPEKTRGGAVRAM